MTNVIGWDIGGANLKAARVERGQITAALTIPCNPHYGLSHLESAIAEAARRLGSAERHGLTMTAELSDAFESRARGVGVIAAVFKRLIQPLDLGFYAGEEGFVSYEDVGARAPAVASANWRASADFLASRCANAVLVDMGSTTTDLVPIENGKVTAKGGGDAERLANGELVYTGLLRGDPLACVALAPINGRWTSLLRESFADMADVHRILGNLPSKGDAGPTADGRARTIEASMTRLARLAGRDLPDAAPARWRDFADFLARQQRRLIEDQLFLLRSRGAVAEDAAIVGAGVGRALLRELARAEGRAWRDFSEFLTAAPNAREAAADCAPAAAIALLLAARGA